MDFSILSGLRHGARAPVAGAATAGIAMVRAYWEALRRDGGIPARSEIDPRGISAALDRVFLAERIAPGLAQIRIAGSALSDIAALDPRGLPLSCLFAPDARSRLAAVVERVFNAPLAADLTMDAVREFGRPALEGRLLMLPLCDAGGGRTLLIGCLELQGEIGRSPRRFDIRRAVEERLLSATRALHTADVLDSQPGHVPHLRLVHSAD
jgi:hypothetical protein